MFSMVERCSGVVLTPWTWHAMAMPCMRPSRRVERRLMGLGDDRSQSVLAADIVDAVHGMFSFATETAAGAPHQHAVAEKLRRPFRDRYQFRRSQQRVAGPACAPPPAGLQRC